MNEEYGFRPHPHPPLPDCDCPSLPYPCPPSNCVPVDPCDPCYSTRHVTQYYHLPLWRANDVVSWLVGLNGAMKQIDALFHDFALRTGIDGEPTDLIRQVAELKTNQDNLLEWQTIAIKDMAATTKVVSDVLANFDLVNEKIRTLNFNYSNLDVRVRQIEQKLEESGTGIAKILESIMELKNRTDTLEEQVENILNPDSDGGENNEQP